ncbi:hypothetical protein CEXT_766791 [Caerostris extrusa]|uniref:Uncharacterized protein n=1 Tax=Caerostris extrusa TaxID=172846 RepID=A0AAV4V259_CAEEX|nr:hypothetical protein CEXT_766791 [Caerostris extrusa]
MYLRTLDVAFFLYDTLTCVINLYIISSILSNPHHKIHNCFFEGSESSASCTLYFKSSLIIGVVATSKLVNKLSENELAVILKGRQVDPQNPEKDMNRSILTLKVRKGARLLKTAFSAVKKNLVRGILDLH